MDVVQAQPVLGRAHVAKAVFVVVPAASKAERVILAVEDVGARVDDHATVDVERLAGHFRHDGVDAVLAVVGKEVAMVTVCANCIRNERNAKSQPISTSEFRKVRYKLVMQSNDCTRDMGGLR